MALVIVLEDGWDGHYVLSSACHQAGYQVLAVQHPASLQSTVRSNAAAALIVDTALPGVSMSGIGAIAAEAGLPVLATGYGPWPPMLGLAGFVPKPASPAALLKALDDILLPARVPCAAA
jgi:CheY-like chemotaxis protein